MAAALAAATLGQAACAGGDGSDPRDAARPAAGAEDGGPGGGGGGTGGPAADAIPGDGWAPPPPDGAAAVAQAAFAAARARATCEALAACAATAVIEARHGPGAACAQGLERQIRALWGDEADAAVAAGRIRYDGGAAWRCVQGTYVAPCDLFESEPACGQVYVGLVEAGGACEIDLECVPGHYCDAAGACPGVCAPTRPQGGPCTADRQCGGLSSCRIGTCQARLRRDTPCSQDGAECTGLLTCSPPAPGMAATFCRNPFEGLEAGARCRPGGCAEGLYCRFAVSGEHTCAPRRPPGSPCFHGFPDACVSGQACDFGGAAPRAELEGACVDAPGDGQPCLATCAPGHACLRPDGGAAEDGRCRRLAEDGAPCQNDDACLSLTCHRPGGPGSDGVCRARVLACDRQG